MTVTEARKRYLEAQEAHRLSSLCHDGKARIHAKQKQDARTAELMAEIEAGLVKRPYVQGVSE